MEFEVKMKAEFLAWKRDRSFIDLFKESNQTIIAGGKPRVLVEAFLYIPPKTDTDILTTDTEPQILAFSDLNLSQQRGLRSLPFVKVIHSIGSSFEPGQIFGVKDQLAKVEYNERYKEWNSQRAMQPSMEGKVPMPPMYFMGWDAWDAFKYKINKFTDVVTCKDQMVFLIPEDFLITNCNYGDDNPILANKATEQVANSTSVEQLALKLEYKEN
jgi:hypothetical protein